MSSFRRSRAGSVLTTWREAMTRAETYAFQLNLRHRVRGVRIRGGWVWKVERAGGQAYEEIRFPWKETAA
jgi:hypothetical protein